MSWWLWVLFGIGLLFVELVTPGGLFALFFGIGAILTAIVSLAGAGETVQWLAFTAISVVLLATLRRSLQRRLASRTPPVHEIVGEEVMLLADLPEGGEVKAELRGVPWSARAASGLALRKGQRCRVERIEGLTLWVRSE